MRTAVLLGLCGALTAAGISGCREVTSGPGIQDQGVFFITATGHGNTSFEGTAAFTTSFQDGAELLTITFITEDDGFELVFTMRDFRGSPEVVDVTVDPDRFSGHFSYVANGQRVQYAIDGGTLDIEAVARYIMEGEINLLGTAVEGPTEGTRGSVQGGWKAVCEGECIGGGGPPPGS